MAATAIKLSSTFLRKRYVTKLPAAARSSTAPAFSRGTSVGRRGNVPSHGVRFKRRSDCREREWRSAERRPQDADNLRPTSPCIECPRQRLPLPRMPEQALHRPSPRQAPSPAVRGRVGVGAPHWANGGETKLSNLASRCRFHHHAVHEGGVQVVALDDGAFRFVKPNGEALDSVAEGFTQPLSDWSELVEINADQGVHIDNKTAVTRWCGEKMD